MMSLRHVLFNPRTAMHRTIFILVCAAVVAHMAFGCCWHHAHAAATCPKAEHAAEAAPAHCDDHGLTDCAGCHNQQPCPHDHHCDGVRCVFTRAESDDAPRPSLERHLDTFFGAPVGHLARAVTTFSLRRSDSLSSATRRHLLDQVLLL